MAQIKRQAPIFLLPEENKDFPKVITGLSPVKNSSGQVFPSEVSFIDAKVDIKLRIITTASCDFKYFWINEYPDWILKVRPNEHARYRSTPSDVVIDVQRNCTTFKAVYCGEKVFGSMIGETNQWWLVYTSRSGNIRYLK